MTTTRPPPRHRTGTDRTQHPRPPHRLPPHIARAIATGGGALTVVSTFLAWTWTAAFPGDLTVYGYPGGLQVLVLVGGALTALFGLSSYGIKGLRWLTPAGADSAVRLAALGAFATAWFTVIAISRRASAASSTSNPAPTSPPSPPSSPWLGALALPYERPESPRRPRRQRYDQFRHNLATAGHRKAASPPPPPARETLPAYAEILIIAAVLALGLAVFTYGIDHRVRRTLHRLPHHRRLRLRGALTRPASSTASPRSPPSTATSPSSAPSSPPRPSPSPRPTTSTPTIGVNILIFATVALGLNIVVGLAGLLDLGYVAFLGVGAYAAALVSGSPSSASRRPVPLLGRRPHRRRRLHWSSASSSAPPPCDCAATTSPSSPSASERSSASPSTTSTAPPDPTSPTAPTASPRIPDLDIFGFDFGDHPRHRSASPSAASPTTSS